MSKQQNPSAIYNPLLRWFARHKRILPWRTEPRNPYHVWLSEVMLQQTQVNTVIPYYERWLKRFPTLSTLAAAPLDDILKAWEGLGYYSRARNFHRAAQIVVGSLGGIIPSSASDLRKLPGVGRYTAGAIASIAFHQDTPILDGNVIRVLSRIYAIKTDVGLSKTLDQLWSISESLIPHGRAGLFNEALMDLGATICTPRAPSCPSCPLHHVCIAYAKGTAERFPVKGRRKKLPQRFIVTAALMDPEGCVLVAQRPVKGLLGGLWEFPGGEISDRGSTLQLSLSHILRARLGLRVQFHEDNFIAEIIQGFSHFTMQRYVAFKRLRRRSPAISKNLNYTRVRWIPPLELSTLALTRSDQKIMSLIMSRSKK